MRRVVYKIVLIRRLIDQQKALNVNLKLDSPIKHDLVNQLLIKHRYYISNDGK